MNKQIDKYIYIYIYIYIYRERGSAPKRGRHSTIISFSSTECICAVAA